MEETQNGLYPVYYYYYYYYYYYHHHHWGSGFIIPYSHHNQYK